MSESESVRLTNLSIQGTSAACTFVQTPCEPLTPGAIGVTVLYNGFRLCLDNVDKNFKRRHLRFDRTNSSLH
jgi:hypothetical protein